MKKILRGLLLVLVVICVVGAPVTAEAANEMRYRNDVETVDIALDFSDLTLWRTGHYIEKTGTYAPNRKRICLNEIIENTKEQYEVIVSDESYRMVIRELNERTKIIASVDLGDGDVYVPSEGTVYLAISIYNCVQETGTLFSTYEQLFASGFQVGLDTDNGKIDVDVKESYEDEKTDGGKVTFPNVSSTVVAKPAPTAKPVPKYELVSNGYYDYNVIPDKYNTGCSGTLTKINSAGIVDGVEYSMGNNGTAVLIDWYYRNKETADAIVIKNVDFSEKEFQIRNAAKIEVKKTVRFENCKFGFVSVEVDQENAEYIFTNCSFTNFSGSNCTFINCSFGGSYYDGLNPFKNVTLKNCYLYGFPQWNEGGKHTDAMQIYGKADIDAENILFSNCRVEIPIIKVEGRQALINACFMVQLEYSNARNFLFEDCIINGGGYSIYAWDKRKGWALDDVVFRNISIGSAHLYDDIYPHISENVVFDNLKDTEKLYVASVWTDDTGKVHLSVSNDTAEDKTLIVVTETGRQEFLIPCKASAEAAGATEYYDLPIDIEIILDDAGTDWIVCYDGEETQENQIRFVNWGSELVYRVAY